MFWLWLVLASCKCLLLYILAKTGQSLPRRARLDEAANRALPDSERSALITAIAQINSDLQPWRTRQQSAGVTALADVAAEQIDGISTVVHAYVQAVYCTATAALLERMRDYDTTWEGHTRADRVAWPIDDYKRDAWYAIQQILASGVPGDDRPRHNVIELI